MKPQFIIIHHSLTKDSQTVSWDAIRRYHLAQGWNGIGYHFGIERIGDRVEVLLGRRPDEIGAHCLGMNTHSLGICCVGNYDQEAPPAEIWGKCLDLTRWLMALHGIAPAGVLGHRELANYKSCPGLCWDMKKFRSELK